MSTWRERISSQVRDFPERKLQTLMHNVNVETLREAHRKQATGKAAGVDKVTKELYNENLDENLNNLVARMKTFSYRPQPVRRAYIPKGNSGKMRPLGIPAYEDKLVQSVMADILTCIYEPRFCEFSFGYRPGKGCHAAIKYLNRELMKPSNHIVDVDIKGFFDNIDHDWLMKFLEHDIADKNFLRYIKRFLKSGVMEEGKRLETDKGSPQGGLISPVLANVYLHYALDLWFEKAVQKHYKCYCSMTRYADDTVICFQYEVEAVEFYTMLKNRLAKFGLELSEEKSKIIRFGRYAGNKAERFDFLGFSIVTSWSRDGKFHPRFLTSQKKLKEKREAVKAWLRENMHTHIPTLIGKLNRKLSGHYNYYGVTRNYNRMKGFYRYVVWQLQRALRRRSNKHKLNWDKFNKILEYNPIVKPRIAVDIWH